MRATALAGSLLLLSIGFPLAVRDAAGAVVIRLGAPFSAAEKDSLRGLGLEYREIDWTVSQLEEGLELDLLQAGVLQPNFFEKDEDIAATVLTRGGWVGVTTTYNFWDKLVGEVLLDQDPATSYRWPALSAESFDLSSEARLRGVTLVLGGRFLVREIRFRPLADRPDHFLEQFRIGISDADFNTFRVPWFSTLLEVRENTEAEVSILLDPPVTTEAIQLRITRDTPKEIGLADFEVYGGGFVGQAAYESDVIELDEIASWGEIRWSGRRDSLARVDIRTRIGSDPQPEIYWETRVEQQDSVKFLQGGGDLSLAEYKRQYGRFSDFLKPMLEEDRATPDTENWSFWSSPYPFDDPGVGIVSPGPRRFIQLRTEFTSTTDDGGKIDYVEFKASVPPSVRRLVGEIHPVETIVGEPTRFTYFIRPTIRSGDIGFDGVEISTPSGVLSVDSLRIGGIELHDFTWTIAPDRRGFEVLLPRKLDTTDNGALLEVVFRAPVLREVGTRFAGRVFDTGSPHEVRQRVVPGNASDDVEGDRLSVTTSLSSSLVFAPRVWPSPFTPNGDGVNEAARISYKLLRVTSSVPVAIGLFDLSGRRVKQLYEGTDPLGEYEHSWDGRDDSGRLVPPGLYLYRIEADLHSQREINSGILSVAY